MAANTNTSTASTVYLSAETPLEHKASTKLADMVSSVIPAAMLAAMLPVILAGCLTQAVLACALTASLAAACAFGIAGCLAENRRSVGYAAFAVCLVSVFLMLAAPAIREGLFASYNGVVYRFDDAYGAYLGLISSGELVTGSVLFGICFGAFSGSFSWAITRLRTSSLTLLAVVVLCGGCLRLGCGMGTLGAALGLCAWLSQCRLIQLRGSSYPLYYIGTSLAFNIIACALFFGGIALAYSPAASVTNFYNDFEKGVDQLRYGSDTLPEGNLANAAAMNKGQEERLSLKVDGQVSDDLLLQGFTGATFENGEWKPISHTAYEGEWKGIMTWLGKQGFTPAEQRSEYDSESEAAGKAEAETATISVDSQNANSRYLYTPYTMSSLDGAGSMEQDGSPLSGFIGTRNYRFTMDDVSHADVFADAGWLASSDSPYAQAESVYATFAHNNYLEVSEDEKQAVEQLIFNEDTWDASASSSEYAVISRVRTMLDTLASYSETPTSPASSSKESFTEWFLSNAHQGNSAYFATAATLAFRTKGIPARYVEGYRADAESLAEASQSDGALSLNSHDAHAWVEVYLNGIGWTPVEVTPGFYSQSLEADKVIDVNEARSNGSGDIMQSESVMGDMDQQDQEEEPTPAEIAAQVATDLATVALCLFIVVLGLIAQRKLRIVHRNNQVNSEVQGISVPALYRLLSLIMEEGGIGFDHTRPLDCLDSLQKAFPDVSPEEFTRVVNLHQAFAFGEHELKPNEMRTLRRFASRMQALLPEPRTILERFKRTYLKAL